MVSSSSSITKSIALATTALLGITHGFAPISTYSTRSQPTTAAAATSSTLSATAQLAEGLTKTVLQQGSGPPLRLGDVATVSYGCYIKDGNDKSPFARSTKQKVVVGDGVMIEGWEKALSTMIVGEKAIVSITGPSAIEQYGYGSDGVAGGIVPPNSELELEIEVLDAEEQKNMGVSGAVGSVGMVTDMTGSGDLGALDPSKPRTPESIAAAYKARQEKIFVEKPAEKEGFEGLIEKAKGFYFFGFFEGETGEQAPWILRPSITFPIAFAIVGAGFYVTFALGGISERGAQVTDELDDIILSFNVVKSALVVAFAQMGAGF